VIVLAVDPGVTNLGWAILSSVRKFTVVFDYGVFTCKSEEKAFNNKMDEENYQVLEHFTKLMNRYEASHVAWELPPGFGGMGQQSRIISNMTVLKTLVWQVGLPFSSVSPITMKKKFTGSAKAEKSEIRDEVIRRWPHFDDSNKPKRERTAPDIFDSIGIGAVAIEMNEWRKWSSVRGPRVK